MLEEMFPRDHARLLSLRLLGSHLEGLSVSLRAQRYPYPVIRLRVVQASRAEALLRAQRVRRLCEVSVARFLSFAPCCPHRPRRSQRRVYLAALIRSLARYLDGIGALAHPEPTPQESLVAAYCLHLKTVRGLVSGTTATHAATVAEFLATIDYDGDPQRLRALESAEIESFVRSAGARLCRASLQHTVARLRSFLRFLTARGQIRPGLDSQVDAPRVYRGEKLPRSLPWESVRALLASIDRTTGKGRRDYAMFLLAASYGLRASEIVALRLDDIRWREDTIEVDRPKTKSPIVLPLTQEVGAALADYLRHGRPEQPFREVFLRVPAPVGPLRPSAVTGAFRTWAERAGIVLPVQGPHCLRHSLAVHLLRRCAELGTIGSLLGHAGTESTCVYLRLKVEDLRDAALDLPQEVRS